jgi:hypothetical protein
VQAGDATINIGRSVAGDAGLAGRAFVLLRRVLSSEQVERLRGDFWVRQGGRNYWAEPEGTVTVPFQTFGT